MWTALDLVGLSVAHLPDGRALSLAHGPGGGAGVADSRGDVAVRRVRGMGELPTALVRYDDGSTVARFADGREEPYAIPPGETVVMLDAPGRPYLRVTRESRGPVQFSTEIEELRPLWEERDRLEASRATMPEMEYRYTLRRLEERERAVVSDPQHAAMLREFYDRMTRRR